MLRNTSSAYLSPTWSIVDGHNAKRLGHNGFLFWSDFHRTFIPKPNGGHQHLIKTFSTHFTCFPFAYFVSVKMLYMNRFSNLFLLFSKCLKLSNGFPIYILILVQTYMLIYEEKLKFNGFFHLNMNCGEGEEESFFMLLKMKLKFCILWPCCCCLWNMHFTGVFFRYSKFNQKLSRVSISTERNAIFVAKVL